MKRILLIGSMFASLSVMAAPKYTMDENTCRGAAQLTQTLTRTIANQTNWDQFDHDREIQAMYNSFIDKRNKANTKVDQNYYNAMAKSAMYLQSVGMQYAMQLRELTPIKYPINSPLLPGMLAGKILTQCKQQSVFYPTMFPLYEPY